MRRAQGLAAMAVTVVVWAGFALSIRGIGASTLTVADAALIRFVTPVVLLAPWIPATLRRLRGERPAVIAALCAGAGLPYFLVAALAGRLTSAALVGLVIPGTVPLFVALLAYKMWGSKVSKVRVVALGVILAGVATAMSWQVSAGMLVLLAAGLIWAVYTVALRVTRLTPVGTAVTLCLPSALTVAALTATGVMPSNLATGTADAGDVLTFLLVQGVGVGVLAALCYSTAIRGLGSGAAASLGALSPVLTALAAIPLFGEPVTVTSLLGLALVVGGVVTFNRPGRDDREEGRIDVVDLPAAERGHVVAAHRGVRG